MTLAALGVVFGDIGTSPLYAVRECFFGAHAMAPTPSHIFGVLSLVVWSLILVITVKYLLFVLRADNRGEGGILALMAIALGGSANDNRRRVRFITMLGIFGAALLYGDGVITPAVTVMSAVEGLNVATPVFMPYVMPITILILIGLFAIQRRGTATIGKAFGPIIVIWFITLGVLGVSGIIQEPAILGALNPGHAVRFMVDGGWHAFVVLGAVFLSVTGGEALYADLGHFGARPIRVGWFFVALPTLLLQYFGQGALLLQNPGAAENPLFLLAPSWFLYPLVALATAAAIIASQAVVTGAFSLTQQAAQLGLLPRVEVRHTSPDERGQIYVPFMNWALLVGTLYLVLTFQSSSALAGAYGIAVTATMGITTLLMCVVMRWRWKWSVWVVAPFGAFFLIIDLAFFAANSLKIFGGGWFPLLLGATLLLAMTTWRRGRGVLRDRLMAASPPIENLIATATQAAIARTPGVAVFMAGTASGAPAALVQNIRHNRMLHETNVLLTIMTSEAPHIQDDERLSVTFLGHGFYRVKGTYGFMESPNVPALIERFLTQDIAPKRDMITYFMGRETLVMSADPVMTPLGKRLFTFLSRNAYRATDYFHIPSDQVIEIGTVVEL